MTDASHAPSRLAYGAAEDFGYFDRKPAPVGQSAGEAGLPPGPAAPPVSRWPARRKWIRRGVQASIILIALAIIWLIVTAPLSKSLQPIAPPRLTLVTADGQPIARNGAVIERPVKAADLPPHVAQAFLAIEDRRFYSHWGVDPRGLARAALNNMGSGGTQGGSTITQQLAKITFLTPERSMTRKARELLISFWMEIWLTKDQILERYLSNVYFGDNVYGLRAASMHYFYRQPEKLTVAQSAMLAGLVQAPSRLAPTKNLKAAEKRMRMVLAAMVATGDLTEGAAKATRIPRLDVRRRSEIPTGTYFADWAMPAARAAVAATYGEQRVTTALDSRLQNIARRVVNAAPLGKAQVALVAMRPSGEVVAMIGGKSYKSSTFNRATQARRQPGSTFKLFVYYAALRAGMTPDTQLEDTPITEGSYRPKNSGDRYRGTISLEQAFAQSSNVAAVRLYRQLGDEAIIKAARDLGIRSPLAADPSLALGSSGVTLLELTSAYAAIAAGAYPVQPRALPAGEQGLVARIFDGRTDFTRRNEDALRGMLQAVVTQGTGRAARIGIDAFGKTGTSQDNRDALFVGFAGDLIVGVWIGNDDNTPLRGISGGGLPARIWHDFMGQAISGAARPVVKPRAPDAPVEPLDLPELPEMPEATIPIGNRGEITLGRENSVTFGGDIGGIPVDLQIDRDGVRVTQPAADRGEGDAPRQ